MSIRKLGCYLRIPFTRVPQTNLPQARRSMVVTGPDAATKKAAILSNARLIESNDPEKNNIRTLVVSGTPYEVGFQHGALLERQVHSTYSKMLKMVLSFVDSHMLDEAYDLMQPFIPQEYKEEMRGLAHGANIPLRNVQWAHAVPEISEYAERDRFFKFLTFRTCSLIGAYGSATSDEHLFTLRNLDWIRLLNVQENPVVIVYKQQGKHTVANFTYAGFIGCITGMNSAGLSFGEMGHKDSPNETLEGTPWTFMVRDLLSRYSTLDDAIGFVGQMKRTCSYVFVIGDQKTNNAKLIVINPNEYHVFNAGEHIAGETYIGWHEFPPLKDVVYGGMYDKKMHDSISRRHGRIDLQAMMEIADEIASPECVQTVIMRPPEAWVANAVGRIGRSTISARRPYHYVNLDRL